MRNKITALDFQDLAEASTAHIPFYKTLNLFLSKKQNYFRFFRSRFKTHPFFRN